MAIPLSDYKKIFSRPGRIQTGDDGFAFSPEDEKALDKAWATVAKQHGVEQLPDQPSQEDIKRSLQ